MTAWAYHLSQEPSASATNQTRFVERRFHKPKVSNQLHNVTRNIEGQIVHKMRF